MRIPVPANGKLRPSGLNRAPASNAANWPAVWSATGPDPLVVRSSVGSWMTTRTPSRVRRRSNSIASTPNPTA